VGLSILAVVLAISIPVAFAVHLARLQSLQEETIRDGAVAMDILRRAEETRLQLLQLRAKLIRFSANPTSPEAIATMRELDIGSSQLQMVGYVKNDRLICSSLGSYGEGIPVGPVSYRGTGNADMRVGVELPFAPGKKYLLVTTMEGFTAVVHPDLVFDIASETSKSMMGLFGFSSGKAILQRGRFNPDWRRQLGSRYSLDLFDGNLLVSLRRSKSGDFVAYSTSPASEVDAHFRRFALILVPPGVLVGLLLTLAMALFARRQQSLPAVIKAALRNREFYLLYQPIVDLQSGEWCGAEALLRWRRKDGQFIGPDLFIPAAENSGLITQLTEYVIEMAFHDFKEVLNGRPDFHLGINFATADLESPTIVSRLRDLVTANGLHPSSIVVEITERGIVCTPKGRETIQSIRGLGMTVAIDDFGTGYSSLSYLNSLEVDYLKIDKSFVDTIGTHAATKRVIYHIISMARHLNIQMIAEGVETEEQAQFLKDHGVQQAQGWLYAKALPISDILAKTGSR